MPKPYSLDLRERVVRYADEGHSRRAAAAHLRVSVSFVVNLVKAFRVREALPPSPAADAAIAKLEPHRAFLWRRSPRRPTSPCRSWRPNWPPQPARRSIPPRFRVGSSALAIASKTLRASGQHDRPDIKHGARGMDLDAPADHAAEPHRLFLDETGTTTKMARPARPQPEGQEAAFESPVRTLEDADLHRRPAMRRPDRPL